MSRFSSAQIGACGAILIAIGSFGAGATRYRGGIVDALGLGWITFGHGFALFELMVWIGILAMLAAWLMLGRALLWPKGAHEPVSSSGADGAATAGPRADSAGSSSALATINRTMVWWLVPLSLSAPLFSRDVYSYLMQGAMMRDGFDPYTEGAAVNPGPMLLEVSGDWRNTTTPYGPLHLGIGEAITRVVGDNITVGVILFRILCLAGFFAIAWSIPRLARHLGGNSVLAQWLGVLNPLVLLHVVAGLHNESVMVGLVSLALVAVLAMRPVPGAIVSAVLIGVAVSLKATAVIALPFVVWMVVTRHRPLQTWTDALKRFHHVVGIGISQSGLMVGTLALITVITGSTWGWVTEISGNTKVINPLAAPSAVAGVIARIMGFINDEVTFNIIVSYTRTVSSLIMLLGLVVCWLLFFHNPRRNVAGMVAAYGVACVFNAVVLPWYYASVLTPIGAVKPPKWVVQGTVFATLVLCLSFSGGGNNRFYDPTWMIVVTIAAWLATSWLFTGKMLGKMTWRDSAVHVS